MLATGILIGLFSGWMLAKYFEKVHIRDTIKILIILSLSFILTAPLGAFAIDLSYKKLLER